ncbi:MAG: 4Fe-4S dicluster domain-containing protein [Elusimicrobia bacterium]|nr:4Fe-4S dicluster domain-containing protein [Elusimicrobiota bacterium]
MSEPQRARWRSLEDREGAPPPEEVDGPGWSPLEDARVDRRSFLTLAGFFVGSGALSACSRGPASRAVPQLAQPENDVPGKALWYATTCGGCSAGCGALVKVRDGRPVKLEGNPGHPVSAGGLCAVGQASVLELYDDRRLKGPLLRGRDASWDAVDAEVAQALGRAKASGGTVRVLTGTLHGPSTRRALSRLLEGFADAKHVTYDALSASAIREAHARSHGRRAVPRYRFAEAEVIAGIDADFLGTWLSPVEFSAGWRAGRVPAGRPSRMSFCVQFESRMSVTGANADRRVALPPGAEGLLAAHLADRLSRRAGARSPYRGLPPCPVDEAEVEALARRLWAARGKALVVCGANDVAAQLAVNHANHVLGAYGRTLDLSRPSLQRLGDDGALAALAGELAAGKVAVLIVAGCNPAAELPPPGGSWEKALGAAGTLVCVSTHLDETSRLAAAVCPEPHFLEAWGDAEPAAGVLAVRQPVIRPLGDTRPLLESLAAWAGRPEPALEQVRAAWRPVLGGPDSGLGASGFEASWAKAVHDGWRDADPGEGAARAYDAAPASAAAPAEPPRGLRLVLYPKAGVLEGRHAQNPWLQELPDPVTKVVWDNYASLSPATARELGVAQGDLVRVAVDGASLELPALVQPGQHDDAVCVALGYGRAGTERFFDLGPRWISGRPTVERGEAVGRNAAGLLALAAGGLSYAGRPARVEKARGARPLACTQDYHSLAVPSRLAERPGETRDIVRETTLAAYAASPGAGNPAPHPATSLWPRSLGKDDRRWAMAVDLNLCTGCSACVVACQAENNVPVVGKDEVGRRRDLAWLRIDRYWAETAAGVSAVHQPMLCQQCGNAPCESVCPVVAISGSEDGLNQQTYNRCVGTRYCANNCPYKVRRFNWFDYRKPDASENLALNPDVTIRSRGVMEKCSFCVQRIQEAKIEAKRLGEPLRDGEIRTACQQSCPTQAIVFGDAHDPESAVAARMRDPRRYRVLEELHADPAVGYLTRVRNEA